ncbi:MAG: hypothetical protein ACH346_01940 [Chthoniobacterales bacterium]
MNKVIFIPGNIQIISLTRKSHHLQQLTLKTAMARYKLAQYAQASK